ncbi:MAG: thioredoxin domain-containing protein [Planctomycetota bacterium]
MSSDAKTQAGTSAGKGLLTYAIGAIAIVAALVTSGMLVYGHLQAIDLPGCGVDQGCADLTSGKWGVVPGLGWPVSHVGFAFFLGLLPAWLVSRDGTPSALKWLIRVGFLASLFFITIMLVEKKFCLYCALTHGANFCLLIASEFSPRARTQRKPIALLGPAVSVFAIGSIVLGVMGARANAKVEEEAKSELARNVQDIIDQGQQTNGQSSTATMSERFPGVEHRSDPMFGDDGFVGRWRTTEEPKPIRIVVYSDFQCNDCREIDKQIKQLELTRDDVMISHKHYVFCTDCNDYLPANRNLHPNACWAARASEAAGMVKGQQAFWDMHHWLFEKKGSFTTWQELQGGLFEMGWTALETEEFKTIFTNTALTDPQIKSDIDEAMALGLYYTPMIFINGVQLTGWRAPNAVINAVQEIARTNPKPLPPIVDNPPMAPGKAVRDWETAGWFNMSNDAYQWPFGTGSDTVEVIVWGDYQHDYTQKFDRHMRNDILSKHVDVQYTFRHYPMSSECSEKINKVFHQHACKAHKLAESVAQIGGLTAYKSMHAWLMEQPELITDDNAIDQQIQAIGLNPSVVRDNMESNPVLQLAC